MRPSPLRSTLAVLRVALNLSQTEVADLMGKSARTVQAIELGQLKLTEENAIRISEETGVSLRWLLNNDPEAPLVSDDGQPYTKANYESARVRKTQPRWEDVAVNSLAAISALSFAIHGVVEVMVKAQQSQQANLFRYRISRFLEEQAKELGLSLRDTDEFVKSLKGDNYFLKHRQFQALVLDRFFHESTATTEKQVADQKTKKGPKK